MTERPPIILITIPIVAPSDRELPYDTLEVVDSTSEEVEEVRTVADKFDSAVEDDEDDVNTAATDVGVDVSSFVLRADDVLVVSEKKDVSVVSPRNVDSDSELEEEDVAKLELSSIVELDEVDVPSVDP